MKVCEVIEILRQMDPNKDIKINFSDAGVELLIKVSGNEQQSE